MTNREVELILKLRDQATAVWNRFESGIRDGAQRMGRFMAQNWATMGASAAAAFYIISQAFDKVDKLAKKVGKALNTEAGAGAVNAANQVKELSAMLKTVKKLADEALIRVGLVALGMGKSIAVFFSSMVFLMTKSISWIEEGLNALGLSSSKFFQNLNANAGKLAMQMSKEAMAAFEAAFASSKDLGLGAEHLRDKVKRLREELDDMEPGTKEYVKKYGEWKRAADALAKSEREVAHAMRNAQEIMADNKKMMDEYWKSWEDLMEARDAKRTGQALARYWQRANEEAKKLRKQKPLLSMAEEEFLQLNAGVQAFFKAFQNTPFEQMTKAQFQRLVAQATYAFQLVSSIANQSAGDFYRFFNNEIQGVAGLIRQLSVTIREIFKQLAAELAAQALWSAILGIIFPGTGFFGFAKGMGGALEALFPKAHSGMYINAPASREFPIIVRGGETVRTEAQEAALQKRGGGAVNININTIDAKSFEGYLRNPGNRSTLMMMLDDAIRKGH